MNNPSRKMFPNACLNAEGAEVFAEDRGEEAFLCDLCGNLRDLCG
jgi:hypothetical protein